MLYDTDYYSEFWHPFVDNMAGKNPTIKKIKFTETGVESFGSLRFSIDEIRYKKPNFNTANDDYTYSLLDHPFVDVAGDKKLGPYYGIGGDCYFGNAQYLNPMDGSIFVINPSKDKIHIKFVRSFETTKNNTNVTLRDRHEVKVSMTENFHRNFVTNKCTTNLVVDTTKVSNWGFVELGSLCGNFYHNTLNYNEINDFSFHAANGRLRLFFYKENYVDSHIFHPLMSVRAETEQSFVPIHKGQVLCVRVSAAYASEDPKTEGLKFTSKRFLKEANQFQFIYVVTGKPPKERVSFLVSNSYNQYRCVIGCAVGKSYDHKFHRTMICGEPVNNSMIDVQGVDHLEIVFYSPKLPKIKFDDTCFVSGTKMYTKDTSTIALGIKKTISHILVSRTDKDLVRFIPIS